jgi:hypothetical protein
VGFVVAAAFSGNFLIVRRKYKKLGIWSKQSVRRPQPQPSF